MKTELELTKAVLDAATKATQRIEGQRDFRFLNACSTLDATDGLSRALSELEAFKAEQEKESQYTSTITVEKSGEITRTPVKAGQVEAGSQVLHRFDYENIDGKMVRVLKREIFGWMPVNTITGEVECTDFRQFDDELETLSNGWEWKRFTLALSNSR
jgi:hypothetical protein